MARRLARDIADDYVASVGMEFARSVARVALLSRRHTPDTVMRVRVPRLRALRLEEALSQEELAWHAKVARNTIARAEAGGEVRPSTARKLARALRVHPRELQREDEDR